ncbi:MAG TPA: RNA-binding S4 domain-containing protein [Thermoleophilia bacterium]|nr:RNA-binding S4 domain-containing protein [Thermoleophilia bacterium]
MGAFLKLAGAAPTGGEAKLLIQGGEVRVNGAVERRRGHLVAPPDVVSLGATEYRLCSSPD